MEIKEQSTFWKIISWLNPLEPESVRKHGVIATIAINVIVLALYFFTARLGFSLAIVNVSATAVWAPTGIAIAAVLIFGYRLWPSIFLGAFFSNYVNGTGFLVSFGIGFGNLLEAFVAGYFIHTYAGGRWVFERSRDSFKFIFFAGLVAAMVSASFGTTTLLLAHLVSWQDYQLVWLTWWLGDAAGALVVTPVIVLLSQRKNFYWSVKKATETFIFFFILIATSWLAFGGYFPLAYPLWPLLVWAAFRLGRRETVVTILIIAVIATIGTLNGNGQFIRQDPNDSLLLLQFFLIILVTVGLPMASLIQERKQSEARFRALIEHSADAIALLDDKANNIYASPSTKRVLGYTPEELLKLNALNLVHPEDLKQTRDNLLKILQVPGKAITDQSRVKRKDGTYIWIEATGTNLMEEPAVGAVVLNYRDITERKKAQQSLEQYNEELKQEKAEDEALLSSIGDAIVATDKDEKINLINKAFEDLFGYKIAEARNKNVADLLYLEDEEGAKVAPDQHPLTIALKKKIKVSGKYFLRKKNKARFPALITATPVILKGQIVGGVKVIRDITKEQEIDKAKTEFVSLVSHELRGPLTITKWYVEGLLGTGKKKLDTKKQQKYLSQLHLANENMIKLVEAMLNVSRIELGTWVTKLETVKLPDLAQALLSEYAPLIKKKHLTVSTNYESSIPEVITDSKLISIVIHNLISNAVKYTSESGSIKLELKTQDNEVTLSVADSGTGIAMEEQKNIFSKLFRTDEAKKVDPQGLGLGLYLVHVIIEKLGGKVWFDSIPGKGSTFYVSLPRN